jgi:hypothetical protein
MNGSGINNDPKMTNNPLLGRLINEEKQDIVHSSVYGKAQSAENIGTALAESFAARKAMEASRQAIQKYKDSEVVGGAFNNSGMKSWNYDAKKDAEQRAAIREKYGGQRDDGGFGSEERENGASFSGANGKKTSTDRFGGLSRIEGSAPARRNPGISR